MRLISFTHGIVNNLGVKLVALIVAVMVWFNVSGQQEGKKNFVASLRFVNLPDTLTLVGRVPDEAELNITATERELLFIGVRKINVMVNMARATPGKFSQRLSVSDVILPPRVEPGDVRILSPAMVQVNVERLITKRAKVAVILSGSLAQDLLLDEIPMSRPLTVSVTGPESAVGSLDKVATVAIDLSKIRESAGREVELKYDKSLLSCTPDRVVVAISVSPRGQRVLANIPPTILVDDDNNLTEIFPKTVSLTLEGPKSLLDTLSSGDVSILVDLTGKSPGQYTLAPEIIVPDGVEKYLMDVDSLRILVTKTEGAQSM